MRRKQRDGMDPLFKKLVVSLNAGRVWTYEKLANKMGWTPKHARKMFGPHVLTSLNKDRNGVVGLCWVKRKADQFGLWRKKGFVFHIRDDIDSALMYVLSRQQYAMRVDRANKLTGRKDCHRVLKRIVENNPTAYESRKLDNEVLFYHTKQKTQQLLGAVGMRKIELEKEKKEAKPWVVGLDEVVPTLFEAMEEMDEDLGPDKLEKKAYAKMAALIIQTLKRESLRGMTALLTLDSRIREICHVEENDVLSPATMCRFFAQLGLEQLKKLFFELVGKLVDLDQIEMKYICVDSSHIEAWHNQYRPVEEKPLPPEMAERAYHVKWYTGYKIHLFVDAKSELPMAWSITNNINDGKAVKGLIAQLKENLGVTRITAMLGDGQYHSKELEELNAEELGCELIANMNPRNNEKMKTLKIWIDDHFEQNPNIRTAEEVQDAMPQTMLWDWGFSVVGRKDVDVRSQSSVIRYIKYKLNTGIRVAIERCFSRLKEFTRFGRPRMRKWDSVQKHTALCLIAMLVVALVAVKRGEPQNRRRMARIY